MIFLFFLFSVEVSGFGILKKTGFKPFPLSTSVLLRTDPSGVVVNPAILGSLKFKKLYSIFESGVENTRFTNVIYMFPVKNGGFSAGISNFDSGADTLYYIENNVERERIATLQSDFLIFLSYGRKILKNLFMGGSLKYVRSALVEEFYSNSYSLDFGGVFYLNDMDFGLSLNNIGTSSRFFENEVKMPYSITLSGNYKIRRKNFYALFSGGMLGYINEFYIPHVAIETGRRNYGFFMSYSFRDDLNFTSGVNVRIKDITTGYSFTYSRFFTPVHRISLELKI